MGGWYTFHESPVSEIHTIINYKSYITIKRTYQITWLRQQKINIMPLSSVNPMITLKICGNAYKKPMTATEEISTVTTLR